MLPRLGIRWIRVPTEKLVPDISSYLYADTQQAIMKEYHTHSAAAEGERREEEQQQEIEKKKRINEEEEKKLIPFSGAQRIFFEDVVQFAKVTIYICIYNNITQDRDRENEKKNKER